MPRPEELTDENREAISHFLAATPLENILPYINQEFARGQQPPEGFPKLTSQQRNRSANKTEVMLLAWEHHQNDAGFRAGVLEECRKNPNLALSFLPKVKDQYFLDFFKFIEKIDDPKTIEIFIQSCFKRHKEELLVDLFDQLQSKSLILAAMKIAIQRDNPLFLQKMKDKNTKLFSDAFKSLSKAEKKQVDDFLKITSPDWYSRCVYNLKQGYGSMGMDEALLVCAQVDERKSKTYDTDVVLVSSDKLEDFLDPENLAKMASSSEKNFRFIVTGKHWILCDVEMGDDWKPSKFIIVDSLGTYCKTPQEAFDKGVLSPEENTRKYLSILHARYPDAQFYFNYEQKQRAEVGCTYYTLDDSRRMMQMEGNHGKSFSSYVADQDCRIHKISIGDGQTIDVHIYRLPPAMRGTIQSSSLLDRLAEDPEFHDPKHPVNKDGETGAKVIPGFFIASESGKPVNARLDDKSKKMKEHVIEFLRSHTDAEVSERVERHRAFPKETTVRQPSPTVPKR